MATYRHISHFSKSRCRNQSRRLFAAKKISINRLSLDSTNIYAFKGKDGIANWNILIADTTNTPDTTTATSPIINEIDIKHVSLRHTTVTFDDRETNVFANLWDANLKLKANLKKEQSTLTLDFNNKNILFWQMVNYWLIVSPLTYKPTSS